MVELRLLALIALILLPRPGTAQRASFDLSGIQCDGCTWFKGNTHAHTTESDGDSSPEYVAQWYKDHGYDFLVLSDHNTLTDTEALSHLQDENFLLVPGEEVTSGFQGKAVHVNGLNLFEYVAPREGTSLVETVQLNVNAIRQKTGVPHINHPNYGWSLGPEVLAQVGGYRLLEIFNGHPAVHNHGGGGSPGMEEVWDLLLSLGRRVYGIAVDDAHHFQGEFSKDRINPGRGWVAVKSPEKSGSALMEALEAGRFYASTGVVLSDVVATESRLTITIEPRGDFKYTTTFVGTRGTILARVHGLNPSYGLTGSEAYVRARVEDSGGNVAWVQPLFTDGRR